MRSNSLNNAVKLFVDISSLFIWIIPRFALPLQMVRGEIRTNKAFAIISR